MNIFAILNVNNISYRGMFTNVSSQSLYVAI
jgi:hypothetical protein